MKTVEVLLRDDLEPLGRCGDVVRVKPGYARNYLLPNRIAIAATPDNLKAMERRRLRLDAELAEHMAEIETRVMVLSGETLSTVQKADENGHLYGSVNAAAVVELLGAAGKPVEEKDVRLEAPIKTVGTHVVRVHVHGERYAEVEVVVEREGGMPAPPPAAAPEEAGEEATS
jgi:large subunit ribosomal protein L9